MDNQVPVPDFGEERALGSHGDISSFATGLARLLRRLSADDLEKYEHSQVFPFPFFADEALLRKTQACVLDQFKAVPIEGSIDFRSQTRFQDLSSLRIDDFERFVSSAGDKKDPESVELSWSKFSLNKEADLISAGVTINFVTEKKLHTQDQPPGEFNHATIGLTVSGSNQSWVENTFSEIQPYVAAARLGDIYRPLWLFRNKFFILVLSTVLAWIGFIIGIDLVGDILHKELQETEAQVLGEILNAPDAISKLDLLSKHLLSPSTSAWWEPIIRIGAGALTFGVVYYAGLTFLPKLTPNSTVAIGLSNRRGQAYYNVFKFIVFTLIVSGILVPLIREIVKGLF